MAIPTTEKNRPGPQRLKFPPWLPKLEPLPKRFFSRINPEAPICAGHLRINRMKPFFALWHAFLPDSYYYVSMRRPLTIVNGKSMKDFSYDFR